MSAESRLNLYDLLFNIRSEYAELYYFGNMLTGLRGRKERGKIIDSIFLSQLISQADLKYFVLENKC